MGERRIVSKGQTGKENKFQVGKHSISAGRACKKVIEDLTLAASKTIKHHEQSVMKEVLVVFAYKCCVVECFEN